MRMSQPALSEKQKCFRSLKDLENTYVNLSTAHQWDGVGHVGAAFRVSPDTSAGNGDPPPPGLGGVNPSARRRVPFDEWVKTVTCRNCGEKGHLAKDCPNKRNEGTRQGQSRDRRTQRVQEGDGHQRRDCTCNNCFKKAFQAAYEAIGDDSSSCSDDKQGDTSPRAHVTEEISLDGNESEASDSVESLAAHAARMYSSLKE